MFVDIGILFGGFLLVLMAVGQVFLRRKDQKNYLVIVLCLSVALFQFSVSFHMFSGIENWYVLFPYVYITGMFAVYCSVALTYLLLNALLGKKAVFRRLQLLHFIIPAAAALALILFADFPTAPEITPRGYIPFLFRTDRAVRLVDLLSMAYFYAYFLLLFRDFHKRYRSDRGKGRKNLLLILVFVGLTIVLCVFYLFYHERAGIIPAIFRLRFTIIAIFIFITSYYNPFIMNIVKLESYRGYYRKSYIEGLDSGKIVLSLEKLMDTENLYTDEDITINAVAAKLGLSRHQLSEVLNLHLHTTFSQYLRERRLERAKAMLEENPSMKIIDIAGECGFGSISGFNTSFKKRYGATPTEYRKAAGD